MCGVLVCRPANRLAPSRFSAGAPCSLRCSPHLPGSGSLCLELGGPLLASVWAGGGWLEGSVTWRLFSSQVSKPCWGTGLPTLTTRHPLDSQMFSALASMNCWGGSVGGIMACVWQLLCRRGEVRKGPLTDILLSCRRRSRPPGTRSCTSGRMPWSPTTRRWTPTRTTRS